MSLPKPCPVCGAETFCDKHIHYAVTCIHPLCTMRGPCRVTEAEAIAAWNRLAALPRLVEALEEALLMLDTSAFAWDDSRLKDVSTDALRERVIAAKAQARAALALARGETT